MITLHCDENLERIGRQLTDAKEDLAMHRRLGDVVGDDFLKLENEVKEIESQYRRAWFTWLGRTPAVKCCQQPGSPFLT